MEKTPGKTIRTVMYKGLTIGELRKSTYPDSKCTAVLTQGTRTGTSQLYDIDFNLYMNKTPYIRIRTEKRKDFLKKGTEEHAEKCLVALAYAIRDKTGGYISIHSFQGAVYGSAIDTIIPDFKKYQLNDDNLVMIIYLIDDEGFDSKLAKELDNIGPAPKSGEDTMRFINYLREAGPVQKERDIARINGVLKQWDEEFDKCNPHARLTVGEGGTVTRIKTSIPPSMKFTQANVADFADYLQQKQRFDDLAIWRVMYSDVTKEELTLSTLPPAKIEKIVDE